MAEPKVRVDHSQDAGGHHQKAALGTHLGDAALTTGDTSLQQVQQQCLARVKGNGKQGET